MKRFLLLTILLLSTAVVFAGEYTDSSPSDHSLVGRWRWLSVELTGRDVDTGSDASSYLLTLEEDGTMKIKADCRQGSGSWRSIGNVLTLSINNVSSSNCGSGSFADQMIELLNVGAFEYEMTSDTQLQLSFAKGAGKANFLKTNDAF